MKKTPSKLKDGDLLSFLDPPKKGAEKAKEPASRKGKERESEKEKEAEGKEEPGRKAPEKAKKKGADKAEVDDDMEVDEDAQSSIAAASVRPTRRRRKLDEDNDQ